MRALPFLAPLVVLMLAFPAAAQGCVPYLTRSEELVWGHPLLWPHASVDTGRLAYDATGGSSCDGPIEDISCDAGHAWKRALTEQEDPGPRQGSRIYLEIGFVTPTVGARGGGEVWGYVEANGIEGLQRRDVGINEHGTQGVDDTCGLFPPDLLFWFLLFSI